MTADQNALGIVAIGRNEGDRLKRCLRSLSQSGAPVVYVDSGSTDGSIETARAFGAEVVELDLSIPFTAARARNEGFQRLQEMLGTDLTFVQFVDGDCEVVSDWPEKAQAALAADKSRAVVAGRRRERYPGMTIYNRYCDMEWNTPVGEAAAVGGDALYRVEAFRAVGGFNPSLICGEEPELCYRLRQEGWTIERLDAEMTLHDADIHTYSQFAKRMERSGWAFAEGASLYGDTEESYNVRDRNRILLWGRNIPLAFLAAGVIALVLAPFWKVGAMLAALVVAGLAALYPLLALKTALGRVKSHGDPVHHALLYGGLVTLGKFAQIKGIKRFEAAKAAGETGQIIEYKGHPDDQTA